MSDEERRHSEKETRDANKTEWWIRFVLVALAVVLVILLSVLYAQYRSLRREQILNARALRWSLFLKSHMPLPPSDADAIRSWMTFDYVNRLFAMPPDYLKNQLNITDPHYPQLTISNYAKETGQSASTTLDEVGNAVRSYAAPETAPPDAKPATSTAKSTSA